MKRLFLFSFLILSVSLQYALALSEDVVRPGMSQQAASSRGTAEAPAQPQAATSGKAAETIAPQEAVIAADVAKSGATEQGAVPAETSKKEEPQKTAAPKEAANPDVSQGADASQQVQKTAGEFFGVQVPLQNYYFVKGAIMVFGNKWGPQPETPQQLEDCVWNDLLLSYEAFRRNIVVSDAEADVEIGKIMNDEKVQFDWKKDKDKYTKWLKAKVNEPPELFYNQVKHMIQLQKLRQQVMDGITPSVTEDEAHQKFLNEYNTLSIEMARFDERKDAEEFYKKARSDPKAWEEEKNKRPKEFKRPGFVSLEFLIELWKFPEGALYKMMTMKVGDLYPPEPVYKGYGVFKIMEQRPADEALYPKQKEAYHKKIESMKKFNGFQEWVKNLKEQAKIKANPLEKSQAGQDVSKEEPAKK